MKLTRPAVFDQVVMGVMKAAKEGSLREKISDKKLIEMLDKISESSAAAIIRSRALCSTSQLKPPLLTLERFDARHRALQADPCDECRSSA